MFHISTFLKKIDVQLFSFFFRCAHSVRSNLVFRRVGNGLVQVHDQRRHPRCNRQVVKYANVFSKFERKKNYIEVHLHNKKRCSTAVLSRFGTKTEIRHAFGEIDTKIEMAPEAFPKKSTPRTEYSFLCAKSGKKLWNVGF